MHFVERGENDDGEMVGIAVVLVIFVAKIVHEKRNTNKLIENIFRFTHIASHFT